MKDIYDIVADFQLNPGAPVALATLVRVEGSSYRRPGARLLIRPDGRMVGSLSGGCIEEEIARRAQSVLESGEPILIDFDTRRQFGCHGKINIFIERARPELLSSIAWAIHARKSCIVVTSSEGSFLRSSAGEDVTFPRTGDTPGEAVSFPNETEPEPNSFPYRPFVQNVQPPMRLLIFGEGPDSAPLRKLCAVVGWESVEAADVASATLEIDNWTAAIVKSHNFGRDFAALARLLPLDLRYVGLIGPKKRRDELLNELLQIDVPINAGFFAPAGLDLNAETPEEIALSVMSEIQRVFADGSGKSLRDRKEPIHCRPVSPKEKIARWQKSPP
ncbi:MAG TPA: XdhC family protein [Chthoniobacterales bacterium]|nr:XdhC family protein [Chthoniobacterales bacterium]